MKCNGIQGISSKLTEGSICLLYIWIILDLVVGVTVWKTSVLNWLGRTYAGLHCAMLIYLVQQYAMQLCLIELGVHLPSIYMHCPRSINGFNGMQDIYAWLTGKGNMKCNGIQGIYALLTGGHLPSLYIYCPRSSFGCSGMLGVCAWLTE